VSCDVVGVVVEVSFEIEGVVVDVEDVVVGVVVEVSFEIEGVVVDVEDVVELLFD
jgi:hypothetical protein